MPARPSRAPIQPTNQDSDRAQPRPRHHHRRRARPPRERREPAAEEDHDQPGAAPARLRARGEAHRGGVVRGHRVPDALSATSRDDKRQEFILLSDMLGLSMLTVAMNNDKPRGLHRGHRVRPLPRRGRAALRARRRHRQRRARAALPGARHACAGLDGEPVAGRRHRRLAGRRGRPLRRAARRLDHAPGARRAARRRRGPLPLPLHPGRGLSDPARRPGRRHAARDRAPSVAAGAPALHDPGAGLRDADHARVPQRRPVPRLATPCSACASR